MAGAEQSQGTSHLQGSGHHAFVLLIPKCFSSDHVLKQGWGQGCRSRGRRGHSLGCLPAQRAVSPVAGSWGEGGLLLTGQRVSRLQDGKVLETQVTAM